MLMCCHVVPLRLLCCYIGVKHSYSVVVLSGCCDVIVFCDFDVTLLCCYVVYHYGVAVYVIMA